MSITEQLQAMGMRDLSAELTRERLAWLRQIAAANTLREELLAALEEIATITRLAKHSHACRRSHDVARAAIAKAKEATS